MSTKSLLIKASWLLFIKVLPCSPPSPPPPPAINSWTSGSGASQRQKPGPRGFLPREQGAKGEQEEEKEITRE